MQRRQWLWPVLARKKASQHYLLDRSPSLQNRGRQAVIGDDPGFQFSRSADNVYKTHTACVNKNPLLDQLTLRTDKADVLRFTESQANLVGGEVP